MTGQGATEQSFFDSIGGMPMMEKIVGVFYDGVATDPILGPMYPSDDMDGARERLTLFLAQFWGGPTTYSEQRGHPRLRMRHMPYAVTPEARDHWLACFRRALDAAELSPEADAQFWAYVENAGDFLVNSHPDGTHGH